MWIVIFLCVLCVFCVLFSLKSYWNCFAMLINSICVCVCVFLLFFLAEEGQTTLAEMDKQWTAKQSTEYNLQFQLLNIWNINSPLKTSSIPAFMSRNWRLYLADCLCFKHWPTCDPFALRSWFGYSACFFIFWSTVFLFVKCFHIYLIMFDKYWLVNRGRTCWD